MFIRKSHQHAGIKGLSFFVVAVVTAMYVYIEGIIQTNVIHL